MVLANLKNRQEALQADDNHGFRYLLVQVQVPTGTNGVDKMAQAITDLLQDHKVNKPRVAFVSNEDGNTLFGKAVNKFFDGKDNQPQNSISVNKQIRENITNLYTTCKRETWIPTLDELFDKAGSVNNMFDDAGKPKFRIEGEGYCYYFKNAYMSKKAYRNENNEQLSVGIGGKPYLLHEYTFEFTPGKDLPPLENLLDNMPELGTEEERLDKLVELLKSSFAFSGGWGIPSLGLACGPEEEGSPKEIIWYALDYVRMGVEGNFVCVLAPHIDEYEECTIKPVEELKLQWVRQQQKQSKSVESEVSTTSTRPRVKYR